MTFDDVTPEVAEKLKGVKEAIEANDRLIAEKIGAMKGHVPAAVQRVRATPGITYWIWRALDSATDKTTAAKVALPVKAQNGRLWLCDQALKVSVELDDAGWYDPNIVMDGPFTALECLALCEHHPDQ